MVLCLITRNLFYSTSPSSASRNLLTFTNTFTVHPSPPPPSSSNSSQVTWIPDIRISWMGLIKECKLLRRKRKENPIFLTSLSQHNQVATERKNKPPRVHSIALSHSFTSNSLPASRHSAPQASPYLTPRLQPQVVEITAQLLKVGMEPDEWISTSILKGVLNTLWYNGLHHFLWSDRVG